MHVQKKILSIPVCSQKIVETTGVVDQGTNSPHPVQNSAVGGMFAFCKPDQFPDPIQKYKHHHSREHKSLPLSAAAHTCAVKLYPVNTAQLHPVSLEQNKNKVVRTILAVC